jgi:hypothetical protein
VSIGACTWLGKITCVQDSSTARMAVCPLYKPHPRWGLIVRARCHTRAYVVSLPDCPRLTLIKNCTWCRSSTSSAERAFITTLVSV